MNPAVISVLTNGLSAGASEAQEGGTALTAGLFTLWVGNVSEAIEPDVRPRIGSGGSAGPATNSNSNLFQQSNPTQNLVGYLDKIRATHVPVTIRFKMGKKETTKYYNLPIKKAKIVISLMNWVTTFKNKINLNIFNFRKRTPEISDISKASREINISRVSLRKPSDNVTMSDISRNAVDIKVSNEKISKQQDDSDQ